MSKDVADDIRAAMNAAPDATEATAIPEPQIEAPEPAETQPEAVEQPTDQTRAQRQRDEAGRFAKAQADKAAADAKAAQPIDPNAPVPVPLSWKAEERQQFLSLPKEIQAAISRRETEREKFLNSKAQEAAEVRRQFQAIDAAIQPHVARFAASGMAPHQAVSNLLALEQAASANPEGFIVAFAQQRGIDLRQLVGAGQASPEVHPALQPLYDEVRQLRQWRATQEGTFQQATQARALSAVEQFKQTAPYFDHVEQEMIPIVARMRQENPGAADIDILKAAYDKATRLNDDVWSALQQQREAERIAKLKSDAADAARKGGSVRGAPGFGATADRDPAPTIEEELRRAFAAASGRA